MLRVHLNFFKEKSSENTEEVRATRNSIQSPDVEDKIILEALLPVKQEHVHINT